MLTEVAQPIGTRANKTVVEKTIAMLGIGRWRHRREVHRGQQTLEGGGGATQMEHESIDCGHLNGADPSSHHVAEGADLQKAAQAEGHGLSIERCPVVKPHIPAQGNGHGQAVGADDRVGHGKSRDQFPSLIKAVKRIPQGTEQLDGVDGAGLGRVQGTDLAGRGHRDPSRFRGDGLTRQLGQAEQRGTERG